ncbi:MAG: hypothetical protein HYU36_17925 [Planctomycetes bacterium]|nr:hypothetical protein [Planctomycetota bacterium]
MILPVPLRLPLPMILLFALVPCWRVVPAVESDVLLRNAMNYVRSQQQPDGSFGRPQPHLRTGLAMLSLLSLESQPGEGDRGFLQRAARYLLDTSPSNGDLGDEIFRTESHAAALTALLIGHEHFQTESLRADSAQIMARALRYTLQIQDRSSSSPSRGGWKMEGSKGQTNDRRASAWSLLACLTARLYGLDVPDAHVERGLHFLLGSFKDRADSPDSIGGFSVDTEGLAVELISSMGGWALVRFNGREEWSKKNLEWIARHPPAWSGPNYFYSAFFRLRTLKLEGTSNPLYVETRQRLFNQIADHQQADGSIAFPPGNAQNTIAMGPVFSTAMAILVLNLDDSRLPFDEIYPVTPHF